MARKLRVEFPGAIYHITNRGNGRMNIFEDDRDRERLLLRLSESAKTYNVRVYMFCLMTNHILCGAPHK
ncbi:MAG: transposase [Kiritimatiellae bacterium]|jgi:putative transposase|nr:transposase [Kiritimatiellia bacterium]